MVTGNVRGWLRCEGAAVLALCLLLYARAQGRWWVLLVCFFLPDVALLAYLAGSRAGAHAYNAAHSYVGPALLALLSFAHFRTGLLTALIWAAHIGFDRMAGYGLKYTSAFADTHLGKVGKQPAGNA